MAVDGCAIIDIIRRVARGANSASKGMGEQAFIHRTTVLYQPRG